MDTDLTRTIGLGLTTAFVGTYTIYQRAMRQGTIARSKASIDGEETSMQEIADEEDVGDNSLPPENRDDDALPVAPTEHDNSLPSELDSDPALPPAPPSPSKVQSPGQTQSIFILTANSGDASDCSTNDGEEDADNDKSTNGSVDFSLYYSLQQENEGLKRKLDEITSAQEREFHQVLPTTPNGTRWSPHALLEEVTRLRMELSMSKQAHNAAQDQLFSAQQHLHEEQKKIQLITNMIMMGRGDVRNASLEDLVAAVKQWKELALKAKDFEQKCQEHEAISIDSTSKIIDLREQINTLRLGKVQEITELRKQLATTEESHQQREAELMNHIRKLESRLIDSNMQLNSSPSREELVYLRARSPGNTSFQDLTQTMATSSPSKKSITPNRLRRSTSDHSDFTATVPTPLILSSTLSAVLNNNGGQVLNSSVAESPSSSKRMGTPNSSSRPRSGSSNKSRNNTYGSAQTTPPPSRGNSSRLTNYTASSGSKNVSTQEFLRMLNDPSGNNGGL